MDRDGLEPSGVATGRVILGVACVFATVALGLASMGLFYAARVKSSPAVQVRRFPSPELETNLEPRATADTSHGPAPFRRPPAQRAAQSRPPDRALSAAMSNEAGRGDRGYDPVTAQPPVAR